MWWWNSLKHEPGRLVAMAAAIALAAVGPALAIVVAAPALAQKTGPNSSIVNEPAPEAMPDIKTQCTAYAQQTAAEEYLARDSTVRRTSPFQSGPGAPRDAYADSQRQQLAIERTGREKELYEACVARLTRAPN